VREAALGIPAALLRGPKEAAGHIRLSRAEGAGGTCLLLLRLHRAVVMLLLLLLLLLVVSSLPVTPGIMC
jgi:hypothetical protein